MYFFIGITFAVAVGAFARWGGLDRDRAFYPTVMFVIALLYVLFAAIADSPAVLLAEGVMGAGFIVLTFVGFKRSLWLVVVALAAHGIFDLFHPHAIHNPGVPVWWPDFCMSYDIAAAVFLGWRLRQLKPGSKGRASPSAGSGSRAKDRPPGSVSRSIKPSTLTRPPDAIRQ